LLLRSAVDVEGGVGAEVGGVAATGGGQDELTDVAGDPRRVRASTRYRDLGHAVEGEHRGSIALLVEVKCHVGQRGGDLRRRGVMTETEFVVDVVGVHGAVCEERLDTAAERPVETA